jgi:hypothetical protein
MFAVIFFWVFFFIPDSVTVWIASRIGVAKNIGGVIFTFITSSVIVTTFGRFLIGDPLLYGNSTASLYFRGEFPSNKLVTKLKVDPKYATQVFINYYDCWQFDSEPQHELYLATTKVHYNCLFVYLLKPTFYVLLFLSFLLLFLNIFYLENPLSNTAGQGIILSVFVICTILLISFNRLPSEQRATPTGCWAAWRHRCEENYMEFLAALGNKTLSDFLVETRAKLQDLKNRSI